MRGTTLVRLLDMLRAASQLSLNTAHNSQVRDNQVLLLQATQEWLWDDFDWTHLRVERQFPVANGQRFYGTPDDIRIDRLQELQIRYGDRWCRLTQGIDLAQYQQWDSERDVRSWPVARWRVFENDQIELWPIPAQDASADLEGVIKAVGIRNLKPLVDDADTADLDDRMLVDFAAAELLASSNKEKSQIVLARANKRYVRLRAEMTPRTSFKLGQADAHRDKGLRGPPRMYYRIQS